MREVVLIIPDRGFSSFTALEETVTTLSAFMAAGYD
jgi:hypothetical protein